MAYENLPIYRDAMQLAVYMEKAVGHFSRAHKYQIGADLRQQSRRLAALVMNANYAKDKTAVLNIYKRAII